MPETRRTTEAEIIQADQERTDWALRPAFAELREDYDRVFDYRSSLKWNRRFNKRAQEIFMRLI
jgi:hypothetical protein